MSPCLTERANRPITPGDPPPQPPSPTPPAPDNPPPVRGALDSDPEHVVDELLRTAIDQE